jgi:phage gpG-like protein
MAARGGVEVNGVKQLRSGMKRLNVKISEQAGRSFGEVADQVESEVRVKVPRLTGRLAASIFGETDLPHDKASVGFGGPAVPYAGWIEFGGTRGRKYRARGRYLYPSVLRARRQLVKAANDAAEKAIGDKRWSSPS